MTGAGAFKQNIGNLARYAKRARFVLIPNPYGATGLLRARFNDAIFVSLKRHYLFASNEKAANSTLRRTFQTLEAEGALPVHYKATQRWTGPLLQPSDVADFAACLGDPRIKKFCVVRHPYSRLISCFTSKFEKGSGKAYRRKLRELGFADRDKISFAEFLHAVARQPQTEMNAHWRVQYYNVFMDMIAYDEVIKYEQFGARLPALVRELYPQLSPEAAGRAILTKNIQERNSGEMVERYFTGELKNLAQDIYRLDFETFGYEG